MDVWDKGVLGKMARIRITQRKLWFVQSASSWVFKEFSRIAPKDSLNNISERRSRSLQRHFDLGIKDNSQRGQRLSLSQLN